MYTFKPRSDRALPSLGVVLLGKAVGSLPRLWGAHRETPAIVPVLLCGTPLTPSRLLQESKPEQCLAGKSLNTGEQPSQLSMATRYSASPPGVRQLLSVSKIMAQTRQMPTGFTEQHPPGTHVHLGGRPGFQPWLCHLLNDLEHLTWFPTN